MRLLLDTHAWVWRLLAPERLSVDAVLDALRRSAPVAAPLTQGIALRSETLTGFASEDPADRLLVATALEQDLVLVTADRAMRAFAPVQTLW